MRAQPKILVIDYKAGNLTSVSTALCYIKANYDITSHPDAIAKADKVIFPGVGEARQAMTQLCSTGMDQALQDFSASGKPLLGICLGCQILQTFSEERDIGLLDIIPGSVKLFPGGEGIKVPQIGWNTVNHDSSLLFDNIPQKNSFYFVHSYYISAYLETGEKSPWACGTSIHGIEFAAAVHQENVWGTQFHPEKSGSTGLVLLKNFVERIS